MENKYKSNLETEYSTQKTIARGSIAQANEQARANEFKKIELLLYLDSTEKANMDEPTKKKFEDVAVKIRNI